MKDPDVVMTASVTFPGMGLLLFILTVRSCGVCMKSSLVLFGANFTVRYWIRIKVWSGTPMDKSRQLSVTFPDWFASSVLGAIAVVTVSYNFPAGERQVVRYSDSLFKTCVQV